MAKSELKTKVNDASVADFLASVPNLRMREFAGVVDALHRRVTGCEPRMWGASIVGYGSYDYRYRNGTEESWMRAGFSPRKAAMTIYLMGNYCDRRDRADQLCARLGKHSLGKSCLYVRKLEDIECDVLEELVGLSWQVMNECYPA